MHLDDSVRALPHFEQYFGWWAVEEQHFLGMFNRLRSYDLTAHVAAVRESGANPSSAAASREGRTAIIGIQGAMTKYGSSMSSAGSTVRIRQEVRNAARDPNVSAIVLQIDSPGGMVLGNGELAREVAAANRVKPVVAYCDDLCCSAAYWIASQAGRIVANPEAMVGSIGTYSVVADYSRAAANAGVDVHVIRAGDFKGVAAPGAEITDAQLAEFQRTVNNFNDAFLQAVAAGRKMSSAKLAEIADGRSHIAKDALSLGLIDAIQSFDDVLGGLATKGAKSMAEMGQMEGGTPVAAKPATLAELKAEFPESTADFRERCIEAGMTLAAARDAAKDARIAALETENARLKAEADKAAAKQIGVPPLPNGSAKAESQSGDPVAAFDAAVAAKVSSGMSRPKAVHAVVKESPDLHAAYKAAFAKR